MRHGGLALAALIAAATQSEAATFTQTASFGRGVSSSFDQLAPELGPLVEVRLDWAGTALGDYMLDYPPGPPPEPDGEIVVAVSGLFGFQFFFPDLTMAEWSTPVAGVRSFPEDSLSFVLSASGTGQSVLGAGDLTRFVGNDIIRVGGGGTITDVSASNGAGPLVLRSSLPPTGQGSVTITYITAEVPEPATWAMMIAGFGLVGAAMRRGRAIPAGYSSAAV